MGNRLYVDAYQLQDLYIYEKEIQNAIKNQQLYDGILCAQFISIGEEVEIKMIDHRIELVSPVKDRLNKQVAFLEQNPSISTFKDF